MRFAALRRTWENPDNRRLQLREIRLRLPACLLRLALGLLAGGAGLWKIPLPLALAVPLCAPFGAGSVCFWLGGSVGSALFWGWQTALCHGAAGFVFLAAAALFPQLSSARRGLVPLAGSVLYFLIALPLFLGGEGGALALFSLLLRPASLFAASTLTLRRRAQEKPEPETPASAQEAAALLQALSDVLDTPPQPEEQPERSAQEAALSRARAQADARLQAARTLLCWQYRALGAYLKIPRARTPGGRARFSPRLCSAAAAKSASGVSGDLLKSFTLGSAYYLLLCDGMGTGAQAHRQAAEAAALLERLLRLGFAAPDAIRFLNTRYLLSGAEGFATVDLLELSLVSARGALYKCGAAYSYLTAAEQVERLGALSPPPGLRETQVQQIPLRLRAGARLIMVSDGLEPCACAELLEKDAALPGGLLAQRLLSQAAEAEPDDRTAAVVWLTARDRPRA